MSTPSLGAWSLAASDLWALVAWAVVVTALVDRLLPARWSWQTAGPRWLAPRRARLVLLLLAVATAAWPTLGFGAAGLTWAMQLRGTLGDLAVVPVAAALASLFRAPSLAARSVHGEADRLVLAGVSAVVGIGLMGLHIASLGEGTVDLYRLGYTGWWLPSVVTVCGLLAAVRGWWRTGWALAAALALWGLGVPESTNLWDALVDPWWALWCAGVLVTAVIRRARAARDGPEG